MNPAKLFPQAQVKCCARWIHKFLSPALSSWNPQWSSQVWIPIMPSLINSETFSSWEKLRNFLRAIFSVTMWQCSEFGVMKPFRVGNWPQILISSSRSCSILATYWNVLDFLWLIVLWFQSLKCYRFFKDEVCWYKLKLCLLLLLLSKMCGIPEDVWM